MVWDWPRGVRVALPKLLPLGEGELQQTTKPGSKCGTQAS